ncbi:MAG: SusC/RagA family TonB-linked outer membrane protein [Muribaculaceae bacterium]|nr:SusC/RagA family TonB-linked outer membrane protein [Muribaculaceae bacterium]
MKKQLSLMFALALAFGAPVGFSGSNANTGFTAQAQTNKVTGVVRDATGEPLIGATVKVKGTNRGTATDIDGKYSIVADPGSTLVVTYVGSKPFEVKVAGASQDITLADDTQLLDDVVVTAMGVKRDRKALGYAVDDLKADELMKNKSTNPINSLAGKIAGVNVTQSSGAAGSGAQIILRGGTSLERDNQPLFVVDGVIYDNSTSVVGNSAFDGMLATATTNSNRVMDINPEDIESMSVLKGPAASALYGSKAANGVVLITTKSGKEGHVEVNFSTKYMTTWVRHLPEVQKTYKHGYLVDETTAAGEYKVSYDDFSYNSWGARAEDGEPTYDNIKNFFQNGGVWDTNLSVSGGTKTSKFFLSGSYYTQDGIIPTTGFKKATFRFNGEQKFKMFTFGANVAYSQARTNKTLTSAALYGDSGQGTMTGVFRWNAFDDMTHYLNEDGTRYRMFGDRLDSWDERTNPYWTLNKNKMKDNTERITANFSVKADILDWWWVSFRMGVDSYITENSNLIAAGGTSKRDWVNGMYSENSYRYRYLSTNLMSNMNKQFGDFNLNLLLGTATDYNKGESNYRMAWNMQIPDFYSFDNAIDSQRNFKNIKNRRRLVGVYGEFRADWRNAIFVTVTGRNDWASTLPKDNRSYFYPSVSGAIVFTELMGDSRPDWLTFGKVRASWAKVGKDTSPYVTNTYLWPVGTFNGGKIGVGNSWTTGNPFLMPEITKSTEIGLEMRFFNNRLRFDYAFYTNNSYNQILEPRLSNYIGYILRKVNAGDIYNKGMELTIGGIPVQTKDFTWETSLNLSGNRGTVKNLISGVDILYVTDVQVGNARAASFNGGNFMAISGSAWNRVEDDYNNQTVNPNAIGSVILDANGMPTGGDNDKLEIGNREPKFQGGWNNTLTWKNWSFNMLWDFRVGGNVYNGTQYAMVLAGTSKLTENRNSLDISGVVQNGTKEITLEDGTLKNVPVYENRNFHYEAGKAYMFNGKLVSGESIINDYYTTYYPRESSNFMKKVNSLRLRSISLSYTVPASALAKTKFIKGCMFTATATNLLLFTNYDGDPEVAAAGAGAIGSSSVGIDYCGVPSTSSFSFGVNLTF